MPMKISLALGPRRTLSRQTAWGCFTTNLALPGFGSLLGGRRSGYAQVLLSLVAMAMTLSFGTTFIFWYLKNWERLRQPDNDPIGTLVEVWQQARWSLLSIGLFAFAWLWALASSFLILQAAKKTAAASVPPRL